MLVLITLFCRSLGSQQKEQESNHVKLSSCLLFPIILHLQFPHLNGWLVHSSSCSGKIPAVIMISSLKFHIQPTSKFCPLSLWNIFRTQSFPTTSTATTLTWAIKAFACITAVASQILSPLYLSSTKFCSQYHSQVFCKTHKWNHSLLRTLQWFCIALSKDHNPLNELQGPTWAYSLLSLWPHFPLLSTLFNLWTLPHFSHSFYP